MRFTCFKCKRSCIILFFIPEVLIKLIGSKSKKSLFSSLFLTIYFQTRFSTNALSIRQRTSLSAFSYSSGFHFTLSYKAFGLQNIFLEFYRYSCALIIFLKQFPHFILIICLNMKFECTSCRVPMKNMNARLLLLLVTFIPKMSNVFQTYDELFFTFKMLSTNSDFI